MPRQFRWPRDSRPIVEVYGGIRNAIRDEVMRVDAMNRPWDQAETWEERCELYAQFCEGKLGASPGHWGPRDAETREIGVELAHANRQGFLTLNSQPAGAATVTGIDDGRAEVTGLAHERTVDQLARLVRDTRLVLEVREPRGWKPEDPLKVTIYDPAEPPATGGRLLWERLAQPDWDNPTAPMPDDGERSILPTRDEWAAMMRYEASPEGQRKQRESIELSDRAHAAGRSIGDQSLFELRERAAATGRTPGEQSMFEARERRAQGDTGAPVSLEPAPPEPPVGTVLETSDYLDTYRIERTDLGWHIQYRPGENEFGERLTSFMGRGISWGAAWRAWGPPSGAEPFTEVPSDAPSLPPRPPEPPPAWVGMGPDATDQQLTMPPAAEPWRPPPTVPDHSSSLWWLDGKDTSQMSFTEVSDLARRAGDLRDEMQRRGDPPERIAEVDREYQRLLEAQEQARRRMTGATRTATPPTAPSPATSTGVGGGTTMSQQEVIAQLQAIQGAIETTLGATQEAQATLEQQEGHVQQVLDHGGQGADAVAQAVAAARQLFTDAGQHVGAAIQACEEAIQRASAV